jgi:hypothetical protein
VIDADERWVTGDHFGLSIPVDPAALRAGGTAFLTRALRASGALAADNAVARISGFQEVRGGSTGRKLLLSIEYEKPGAHTHTDLFVKFSRDLDNHIRDRGKTQMEPEVLFAALSGAPGFPITVPATQFADYHRDTGTGILISKRIHFGTNGLLDWGCVGQMNVAMALWGAMSGAETDMWDRHLDDLLHLFVTEIHDCGGPDLKADELHDQLMLYVGIMAVGWLLDVPALIRSRFGDAARSLTRIDPPIKCDESVRAPLQMLTNALSLWETRHFGDFLDAMLA